MPDGMRVLSASVAAVLVRFAEDSAGECRSVTHCALPCAPTGIRLDGHLEPNCLKWTRKPFIYDLNVYLWTKPPP